MEQDAKKLLSEAIRIAERVIDTNITNPIYFNGGCYNPTYYKIVDRQNGREIATVNF